MRRAPYWLRRHAVSTGLNGYHAQQLTDQLADLARILDPEEHPDSAIAWRAEDVSRAVAIRLQLERLRQLADTVISRLSAGLLDRPRLSDGAS